MIEGNNYGGGSKEVHDLERQIASAAHVAEVMTESHIADRIREARGRSAKALDLQQINEYMDAIIKEANEFTERNALGQEQPPTHLAEPLMQSGENAMVGLDAELNQLLGELIGYQSNRCTISIVGMGGTGKTTLAKNVYEHKLIKERFDFRAWAAISQRNNPHETLSKLLSSLGESSNGHTIDELGLHLHKTLIGRTYLIVLDDIWSVSDWDTVKLFFPDNKNGSRILLTTRLSNVAKDCGSLLMMNLLDENNSWKLFCEKTFQNHHCPLELWRVGGEIVKLCKGLALSIVVVGGLLRKSPRTVKYWKEVMEDLKSTSNSKEKQQNLDVLFLSYNHLPPHLKPCFLYMGVFQEDSEIRISKIVKLWVAEGFIKPIRSLVLEETAEGFIKDLIDRNLILVYKHRKNGEIGSCGIHDLLRELCKKLAQQEGFFQVFDDTTRGIVHRVVEGMHLGKAKMRLPRVRSIMTSGRIKNPTKYRLLRVVDETSSISDVDYYRNVTCTGILWTPLGGRSLLLCPLYGTCKV